MGEFVINLFRRWWFRVVLVFIWLGSRVGVFRVGLCVLGEGMFRLGEGVVFMRVYLG